MANNSRVDKKEKNSIHAKSFSTNSMMVIIIYQRNNRRAKKKNDQKMKLKWTESWNGSFASYVYDI